MANKSDGIVKCRYAKCEHLHNTRELNKSEAICHGKSSYYHKDCWEYSELMTEIKDLFHDKVNPNVVYSQLLHILNVIVFDRGYDPHFVKFAIEWDVNRGGRMRYPAGLYYLVDNKDVIAAWKKLNKPTIKAESFAIEEADVGPEFSYKPTVKTGFGDVLLA